MTTQERSDKDGLQETKVQRRRLRAPLPRPDSAKNALRHGLNIPVWSDPALAPQAEATALITAGPNADAETLDYARRIGEAQVDLNRVRSLRREVIARKLSHSRSDCPFTPLQQVRLMNRFLDRLERNAITSIDLVTINSVIHPIPLEGDPKLAAVLVDSVGELTRLERYERRALSRRKSAIRNIDAYRVPPFRIISNRGKFPARSRTKADAPVAKSS
jgi:hypothetical protein